MMAPVAPPTIAPLTGSCAAACCIGIARAMARQAEDPKARINPALLIITLRFHIEMRPNRGRHSKQGAVRLWGHYGAVWFAEQQNARGGGPVPPPNPKKT